MNLVSPVWTWVLGSLLVVIAVALSVIVTMQSGKENNGLSGTIVGNSSADTYFGKNKGSDRDTILFRLTVIGSAVLVVLVSVLTILVNNTTFSA